MSIDYFNDGTRAKEDQSNWFASITSISGVLNGAPVVYSLKFD
jgi:hypothetical protein